MINLFKKIKIKINFLKNKFENFKNLNPGDIVWAKMPLPRKNLNNIKLEHQIRPYLIVAKSRFHIFAFQSSSKRWDKAYNYQVYRINKFKYNMNKDSFISLTNIYKIVFSDISKKYKCLSEFDIKSIQKRLKIINSKFRYNISIKIDAGDVIQIENQLYYVYSSDNVYLYCLVIFPSKPSNQYNLIRIDNKNFYVKFEKKAIFRRTDKIQIKNIASSEEINLILKQLKENRIRKKTKYN